MKNGDNEMFRMKKGERRMGKSVVKLLRKDTSTRRKDINLFDEMVEHERYKSASDHVIL